MSRECSAAPTSSPTYARRIGSNSRALSARKERKNVSVPASDRTSESLDDLMVPGTRYQGPETRDWVPGTYLIICKSYIQELDASILYAICAEVAANLLTHGPFAASMLLRDRYRMHGQPRFDSILFRPGLGFAARFMSGYNHMASVHV